MIELKFADKNNFPSGYQEIIPFDTEIIDMKPKVEVVDTMWNGERYDVFIEEHKRILINVAVTEEQANDIYQAERGRKYMYVDGVQYEIDSIDDRSKLGQTEFRNLSLYLLKKESITSNFFSSNNDDYNDYRLILNSIFSSASPTVQTFYSVLPPLEFQDSMNDFENWNEQAVLKFMQNIKKVKFRTYLNKTNKEALENYIFPTDENVIVETGNFVARTGTISVDASGNLTGLSDANKKLLSIGVQLKDTSAGTTYTVATKTAAGVTVTPTTVATGVTWSSEKAYAKIRVDEFEANEIVGLDLYQIDLTLVQSEDVEILEGKYKMYIYNGDTDNTPSGWTTARDADEQLVINSPLLPLRDTENEKEESDRTGEKLVESVKISRLILWKAYTNDVELAEDIQLFIHQCDFVRVVLSDDFETQSGTVDITTGGVMTNDSGASFANLRPRMKVKVDGVEYEIDTKTSDTEISLTTSPSVAVSAAAWQAEKQYNVNYPEVTRNKLEQGIYELDFKLWLVNANPVFYTYK